MKYINKLLSEQTKTTERGEPGQRPRQQSNKTRPKNDIKNKVQMAAKVGPKPGQLAKGEKPEPEPKVEVSHTVYRDMGMLMAEALGLVSEEVRQLPPVPPYKKPGELKKEAEAARKAGKKPAKPSEPDDEATASAMDRDTKMLRRRAGATGSESGSA